MRKPSTALFDLIQSMTPDEKRFFRTFCRQTQKEKQTNNLQLFELINAQKEYDEESLKDNFRGKLNNNQFAVAKNYLYSHLLKAMSAYLGELGAIKKIRLQFRMLEVLFHKELVAQYEALFEKIKAMAKKYDHPAIQLEVMDWERRIWNKQFFRNVDENHIREHQNTISSALQNLRIQTELQSLHTQFMHILRTKGYLRSTTDYQRVNAQILNDRLLKDPAEANSLPARLTFHHIWGLSNLMSGNPQNAYTQLGLLLAQIDSLPNLAYDYFEFYVTLLYNYATTCLHLDQYDEVESSIAKLERLKASFSAQKARIFYCTVLLKTEFYMGTVQFDNALAYVVESLEKLRSHSQQLSNTEYVAFTIAYLHFAHGLFKACNRIIQQEMRQELLTNNPDLQVAVGMLTLILYYEMNEQELFVRSYRTLYRILLKYNPLYRMEINILQSIRKISLSPESSEIAFFFQSLKEKIAEIRKDPENGRAVQYFNFDTWIESKIKGISILDIIREMMS